MCPRHQRMACGSGGGPAGSAFWPVGQPRCPGQQLAELQRIHRLARRRPARDDLSRRTSGGHGCSGVPARSDPPRTARNAAVRCTKKNSWLRMTEPLKSIIASRRQTGPIRSHRADARKAGLLRQFPHRGLRQPLPVCACTADGEPPVRRGAVGVPGPTRRTAAPAVLIEQHDPRRRARRGDRRRPRRACSGARSAISK